MSTFPKPFLYMKSGCPWCTEVDAYLKEHKIAYDSVDVRKDATAMAELRSISGQTKAPTMKWGSEILADFGADELDQFLRARGVISSPSK